VTDENTPRQFTVPAEDAGRRLDQFLASAIPNVSRVRVQQLIEQGKVELAGRGVMPSYRLKAGDQIEILGEVERPPLKAFAEEIPLDIVYEDEFLAVVNKPAGMMVHAGSGASDDARNRGTLVNALLHHFGKLSSVGGELRPGIVHRLDKETSGLLVVAKTDEAHRKLAARFSSRQVRKTYIALVHGWPAQQRGTIAGEISRDRVRPTRMTTRRSGGRAATSHFAVTRKLETKYGHFALLSVNIETGRTHQIRVHLASIGHPVVGDRLYGAPHELRVPDNAKKSVATPTPLVLGRNFLHAAELEFTHPASLEPLHHSAPLPAELSKFLAMLELSGLA
jgi:23S rRNA pseudouridine1911/1915/1917 synthase